MKTREVVLVAVVAALYAVMTIAIAPLSYGPIQFRVSEVLKVLVLFDPWLSLGIGIGTFFANMASPFVGPWELVWMPLTDVAGGLLAWALYRACGKRWPWISCLLYAALTGFAVAAMLTMLSLGGFWFLALSVGASEVVVLTVGLGMFKAADKWLPHRR